MQSPILITGIPRSGATMVAAVINACGAFGGSMSKKGMYSNDKIRETVVQPYLRNKYNDKLDVILSYLLKREGYVNGPWMYKDSNLTLCWKYWNEVYPEAKWVIVRRKTGDIIHSCMETKYMTDYYTEEGWLHMVREYEKYFNQMVEGKLNFKEIWPERMIQGDYKQMYELCDWLGLSWNEEAIKYIDCLMQGNKKDRRTA